VSRSWGEVIDAQGKRRRRDVVCFASLEANVKFGQRLDLMKFTIYGSAEFNTNVPSSDSISNKGSGGKYDSWNTPKGFERFGLL
jgi:hypothetical protein